MNRVFPDDQDGVSEAIFRLHRSGWSIGDAAFGGEGRGLVWVVCGSNGENLIRTEGATRDEAWGRAVGQALGLGMLGQYLGTSVSLPHAAGRNARRSRDASTSNRSAR